jgi:hypothetical protein
VKAVAGFTHLFYHQKLGLSATVNEPNVAQIVANVIHGAVQKSLGAIVPSS